MKVQVVRMQAKGGTRTEYQLADSSKLSVPKRTLREWVKREEVNGFLSGRDIYLSADDKLKRRLETWRDSMNEMVAHQQGVAKKQGVASR